MPVADDGDDAGIFSLDPPLGSLDQPIHGRSTLIDSIITPRGHALAGDRVHILHGMGGSGKTFTALEIARRARHAGRRVLWVSGRRLNKGMRAVAAQRGARPDEIDQAWSDLGSAPDLVWRLLESWIEPWLLILDNADDPAELAPTGNKLADETGWLRRPTTADGLVVVTTKNGNRRTWGGWSRMHEVRPLGPEDGARVLLDRAGPEAGTMAEAMSLSAELGGLPLALHLAGEFLSRVNQESLWRSATNVHTFQAYRETVRALDRSPFAPPAADAYDLDGLETVDAVWTISLDLLAKRGMSQARPLLHLLACLTHGPIPHAAVLRPDILGGCDLFAGLTRPKLYLMLSRLSDFALLEESEVDTADDPAFRHVVTLHPLAHHRVRSSDAVRQARETYFGLAMAQLMAATDDLPPEQSATWHRWDALVPHTAYVAKDYLTSAEAHPQDAVTTTQALELALRSARYLNAIDWFQSVCDILGPVVAQDAPPGVDPATPRLLALRLEVARALLAVGETGAWHTQLQRVALERERTLGLQHPDTREILDVLIELPAFDEDGQAQR